ncbi:MAG: DUF3426 domain-containing protein [Syntrophobacteraceae bacterium]|nr:DUF3426 domain-containing protein [Syntrophobacteraceae bacterium]
MATLVITCESCGAKFRLNSDKLNKAKNKVRCSKCQSVFLIEQPEEDELIHIEISDEENDLIPGGGSEVEREVVEQEESEEEERVVPRRGGARPQAGSSGKKYLIGGLLAVSLVVIIGLAFVLGSRSSIFQAKKVPVGPDKPLVTISDNLKAFYLENTHAGEVLVIEGEVFNKSDKPVSFVMVEGKLFNRKDSVVLTQRCYAGNPLTRKEITHLKLPEIQEKMLNREGQNLKDVRIPPSGEVSFALVFHDLPEINTLSNYSVNVVSSQLD